MVYRQNATELHVEESKQDAAELRLVLDERHHRRRCAAGLVSAVLVCLVGAPFTYAALRTPHEETRCHYVQIKYENAPWIPAEGWHACRQVLVP